MTKDEALKLAFDELDYVQFIDNTYHEAAISKVEVKEILRQLADRLTPPVHEVAEVCPICEHEHSCLSPCGDCAATRPASNA